MYFQVRVRESFEVTTKNGKEKTKNSVNTYIVEAESVTDAEARIHEKLAADASASYDFEVKSVTATRLQDVLLLEN